MNVGMESGSPLLPGRRRSNARHIDTQIEPASRMKRRSGHGVIQRLLIAAALLGPAAALAVESSSAPPTVEALLTAAEQARTGGKLEAEQTLLEQALALPGTDDASFDIYERLRMNFADRGNFVRAIDAGERQLKAPHNHGQGIGVLTSLVSLHAVLRQMDSARQRLADLDQLLQRLRRGKNWPQRGDWWQAQVARARAKYETSYGHPEPAAQAFRTCLEMSTQALEKNPDKEGSLLFVDCGAGLLGALIETGRLETAEAWANELLASANRTVEEKGRPAAMLRVWPTLGRLAAEQGRMAYARQLYGRAIAVLEGSGGGDSSLRLAKLWAQLAMLDMVEGQWPAALQLHRKREAAIRALGRDAGNVGAISVEYAYTLLRQGSPEAAEAMLSRMISVRESVFDQNSVPYWDVRAFHGLALAAVGKKSEALTELRSAIPKMLELIRGERASNESGVLRTARLNWLLEGYLGLLAELADGGDLAAMDEAFRMADIARGSTVQLALAASASRTRIADPGLAELARREQDLQHEIGALADAIGNLTSRGRVTEQDKVIADMRHNLAALRDEQTKALAEIERRFPDYAMLLAPKPVGMEAIQKLLKPGEAVISIYAGAEQSYVWAIPAQGVPRFAIARLSGEALGSKVASLRKALDPDVVSAAKLPAFPYELSHELFSKLLAPVEPAWQAAQELIVIPHGRFAQLPLAILTTAPFAPRPAKRDYEEMAAAPWLIKRVAISYLPAAVAMPALRGKSNKSTAERAFVGFGDPIFSAEARAKAAAPGAQRGIQRRSLNIAPAVAPREAAPLIDFRLLPPLPDTAAEITEIGKALSADGERDVFLNRRAAESVVKTTKLSAYRVVMFATHGLMNGEMPGLYQPALALSNPAEIGEQGEDGMLTMQEILDLKLQADWVVLSACNSAAGGSQNGESVSGLGRAFFYAGAKSLLVTNWAVETTSARLLTTAVFRQWADTPNRSRAYALQQASLGLMRQSAGSGFSYAHPMFWAPYTLVGDGG
ncbi:MAG TPA: CHAT domain-containing protein [Rhodocyclaceae bacterium]